MPEDLRIQTTKKNTIAAAKSIMCEHGLNNLTIEAISKKSGVAKTTIYRHWDSLDDIILSVIDSLNGENEDINHGSIQKDIVHYLQYLTHCFRSEEWARCMPDIIEKSMHDQQFAAKKNQLMKRKQEPINQAIHRAIKRGELSKDTDVELLTSQLVGPLFMSYIMHKKIATVQEIEELTNRTLNGYSH